MTDVQVSNARRISFTALALVAFWVVAWRAYWLGVDWAGISFWMQIDWSLPSEEPGFYEVIFECWPIRYLLAGLLLAILPSVFLSLSMTPSLLCTRIRHVFLSALLMATCSGFVCWRGELIATDQLAREFASGQGIMFLALSRDGHVVSWFFLLLPIIVTTAFVIFGAWRRAVRDADVEAVGEDE